MRGELSILCAFAALAISCVEKPRETRQSRERKPVTVSVMRAVACEDGGSVSYVGGVVASRSAVVSAKYPGQVVSVNVSRGSAVAAGDVLAQLSSESLEATRDAAEATLRQAEDGLARVERLRSSSAVTEVKYVEVRTARDKAMSAYRAARQAVDDCTLRAPFDGVVERVHVSAGEEAGPAAPIVTVVDVGEPSIEISVPESEISSISVGQVFTVTVPALGSRSFRAKVTAGGTVASALSHSYTCTLVPESGAEGLLPGMVCSASTSRTGVSGIVIPAGHVRTDAGGRFVWCVEDGRACKRYIEVDGYAAGGVVVSSGLEDGDLVVTAGARMISVGMRVNVLEEDAGEIQ